MSFSLSLSLALALYETLLDVEATPIFSRGQMEAESKETMQHNNLYSPRTQFGFVYS